MLTIYLIGILVSALYLFFNAGPQRPFWPSLFGYLKYAVFWPVILIFYLVAIVLLRLAYGRDYIDP